MDGDSWHSPSRLPLPPLSLAVVGADYPNKGKSPPRRFEIAMCRPGEPIALIPEPRNPADPRAIAVYSKRGVQIGYLTAERCGRLSQIMEAGHEVRAAFQKPTSYGCVIRAAFDGEEPVLPVERSEEDATGAGFEGMDEVWPDE